MIRHVVQLLIYTLGVPINEIKENGFMGYMMILASGRQIFGIIMIILMVFIAFGLPILVSRLTNPKTVKEK